MGTAEALVPPAGDAELSDMPQLSLEVWKSAQCPADVTVVLNADADLAPDYDSLILATRVIIEFPGFMDGRGFSHARNLRDRGFDGELLAGGQLLPDQWQYLQRCGFSGFVDAHIASEAAELQRFSDAYQADVQQPLPRFRR